MDRVCVGDGPCAVPAVSGQPFYNAQVKRTYENSKQFLCQNILLYVFQLVMKICAMNVVQ